jgi:hypothetical protein
MPPVSAIKPIKTLMAKRIFRAIVIVHHSKGRFGIVGKNSSKESSTATRPVGASTNAAT